MENSILRTKIFFSLKNSLMKLRFLHPVVENRANSEQNPEFSELLRSCEIYTHRSYDFREKIPVSSL